MTTIARGILFVSTVGILSAATAFAKPRPPLNLPPENLPVLWQANFDSPFYSRTNRADAIATDFGTLVSGSSGYALQRSGSLVTPSLVPALDATGHTNVACGADGAALRFWLTSHWSSGPGADAWLAGLAAVENGTNALVAWSLQISADGSTLSLIAPSDSGPTALLSAPITWNSESAHCVAVNFGSETALFIDGQLAASGPATVAVPPQFAQLVLGSDFSGGNTPNCDLDEIYSFACPLTDTSSYYQATAAQMTLGPITPEAIAARLRTLVHTPTAPRMLAGSLNMMSLSLFPPPSTNPPPSRPPFPPTSTNGLQGVAYSQLPTNGGSFWRLQRHTPPLPFDKFPDCPVFLLDNGSYLINDSGISYPEPSDSGGPAGGPPASTNTYSSTDFYLTISQITNGAVTVILHNTTNAQSYALVSRESLAPGTPWLVEQDLTGAANQDWTAAQVPLFGRKTLFFQAHSGPDSGPRVFFLAITGVTGGSANLSVYGTAADQPYDIQTRQNLAGGEWVSQGPFLGHTNWTPVSVPAGTGTSLFMRARSWASTGGSGIPDWWLAQYSLPLDTDPYSYCSSGDGWTLMDAYYNGWSPLAWVTPPAPGCLTAQLDDAVTSVTVSWCGLAGNLTAYQLERDDPVTGQTFINLPTNQLVFVDPFSVANAGRTYRVQGLYGSHGGAASSPTVAVNPANQPPVGVVVRGPRGRSYLAISAMPPDAVTVHITGTVYDGYATTNLDAPVGSFTNGVLELPLIVDPFAGAPWLTYFDTYWSYYTVNAHGVPSQTHPGDTLVPGFPFFDGRQQLADNLTFLLRDSRGSPFHCVADGGSWGYSAPLGYASASFLVGDAGSVLGWGWGGGRAEVAPFEENFFYRNVVFAPSDIGPNTLPATGVSGSINGIMFGDSLSYVCPEPPNMLWTPPASLLNPAQAQWFFNEEAFSIATVGIRNDSLGTFFMDAGYSNYFGLPYTSAEFAFNPGGGVQFNNLAVGGNISAALAGTFYAATALPQLETTGYYFGRYRIEPIPGDHAFSVTNTTPFIVVPVGQSISLAGYAKQMILNGDHTLPAYLGQYFDNAYLADASGSATTKQTGILSEYGEFFPTDPGLVLLKTKPDLTQTNNLQGECAVRVIGLVADVNRDGTLDPSYGGPDNTSWPRPFHFWINDNHDWDEDGGTGTPEINACEQDGQIFITGAAGQNFYNVRGVRDLVDYFPLYVAVGALFQGNAAHPPLNPSDPALHIRLKQWDGALRFAYTSLTPTNFMDYLLKTNVARSLASAPLTTITADGVDLTPSFLNAIAASNGGLIVVEAVKATTMPLYLEVWQDTNLLATTTLYLRTSGVEQMFRHKNLIQETFPNLTSLQAPPNRLADCDVTNEPPTNDKNFVFLHGYNVLPNEARGTFADMFKRMYWSGSHARFYGVTWQGASTKGTLPFKNLLTPNYHTNVVNAFQTAPHLADFIATLTNSGPVTVAAHSLGNMATLSAISDWNAPISQYFMLDAAVPIEAIDPAATTNMMIYSTWVNYTNRLYASDWYQLFATNDARNTLSWNNRLGNLRTVDVYNFYSSGEEVLRTSAADPPPSVLGKVLTQVTDFWPFGVPFGTYTWYWQEKGKGTCFQDWFLGSSHGGWGWNKYEEQYYWHTNGGDGGQEVVQLAPVLAANLPPDQLVTNAFFDMTFDTGLFGASGSMYAQANRNRILADAIPAMSMVAGANPVPKFAPFGQPNKNIDMMTLENGWAQGRPGDEQNKWHHSDYHEVAYTFTYKLFNQFVTTGNLK
jgi:hypothetical protein